MFLIKILLTFIPMVIAEMKKLTHVYSYEYLVLVRELQEAFPWHVHLFLPRSFILYLEDDYISATQYSDNHCLFIIIIVAIEIITFLALISTRNLNQDLIVISTL